MIRKLLWVLGIFVVFGVVTSLVDRHQAKRRRELWAEATD